MELLAPLPSATPATTPTASAARLLDYLPVGLFGAVMGLTGLSVAWHLAYLRYGFNVAIANGIAILALIAFLTVGTGYLVKCFNAPDNVRAEFNHPIAGSLFGTIAISLLLLPIVIAPIYLLFAKVLWIIGAIAMTAFAWLAVDRWMAQRQQGAHASPSWIIPVVGMLDIPLAIPSLWLGGMHGVMVLGLAVGLFFAIPLFTIILSRLMFEDPLPEKLKPTLLILVAPFAVGTSAYIATTGQVDVFAESMFALTLFILAILVGKLRYLVVSCPFRVSWWAMSFPLAASSIAALRIAAAEGSQATDVLAVALLAGTTVIIGLLVLRTLWGVARGDLRTLSS